MSKHVYCSDILAHYTDKIMEHKPLGESGMQYWDLSFLYKIRFWYNKVSKKIQVHPLWIKQPLPFNKKNFSNSLDIPYLRELRLSDNPLQKLEANAFEMIPQLVNLDLTNCNIKKIAVKAFANLQNLEKLYLGNNR